MESDCALTLAPLLFRLKQAFRSGG